MASADEMRVGLVSTTVGTADGDGDDPRGASVAAGVAVPGGIVDGLDVPPPPDRATTMAIVAAALAEITTRQNEDMRKISAWAAIALVPTAIAGIYGMNFEHMPELSWSFGYPMAIALIVVICVLLYRVLRKRGWL